jgi:hypothetical protein
MYGAWNPVNIELLNTVMDDNKLLILANGTNIKMNKNMKLILIGKNTDDLSPASVSRLGIVVD